MGVDVLRVQDISFCYDHNRKSGLHDIAFTLGQGEVLCILGPNGSGKTTLLKCLSGIFRLNDGSIQLNGKEISQLDRSAIARAVGYVPQLHQPVFPFSVLDAVLVGRAPHLGLLQSPGKEDVDIAEAAIEALGISHLRDKPYTQLSGGERQLVVFARVLAQQPALLLLDEPTSHLDFGNQIRVLDLVDRLASSGLPIVMTSHFPDHAFLGSKVAIMRNGKFLDLGPPGEVITEAHLEEAYGVKVKVVDVEGTVGRRVCLPLKSDADSIANMNSLLEKLYGRGS